MVRCTLQVLGHRRPTTDNIGMLNGGQSSSLSEQCAMVSVRAACRSNLLAVSHPARGWARIRSRPRSARAAWEKFIERMMPDWGARWR